MNKNVTLNLQYSQRVLVLPNLLYNYSDRAHVPKIGKNPNNYVAMCSKNYMLNNLKSIYLPTILYRKYNFNNIYPLKKQQTSFR